MAALTPRFDKALFYFSVISRALPNKVNGFSLTARGLATAALVLGAGGDEDEAIAALLLELTHRRQDERLLWDIGALFGKDVLAILQDCLASEYRALAAARRYGIHTGMVGKPPRSPLVALADSMVMALALHSGLILHGPHIWSEYEASAEDVVTHFETLARIFEKLRPGGLATQFATLVSELVCAASPYNEKPKGSGTPIPFRPRINEDDPESA